VTLENDNSASSKCTPDHVANVLAALGKLMHDLYLQDLALQNAISKFAVNANASTEVAHIQHIDLITQTHEDLAQFLPELAMALKQTGFDENKLAKRLRLQSLRDQLLRNANPADANETPSGDLSLF
jgi:hypothetical protein